MSLFAVDSQGNRIETDILVAGYIRNVASEYNLSIPEDINGICFLFWLIKVCDEWDRKSSAESIKIDGQFAKTTEQGVSSVYGSQSVSQGVYSWRIKTKQKMWACIGVIEDDVKVLEQFRNDNDYDESGHGCFLLTDGFFYNNERLERYCGDFKDKDRIITIILDMDKHSIKFKIDDKEYGIATDKLEKDKYRMIISLYDKGDVIELL